MSDAPLQLKISIFDALEPVLVRPNVTVERLLQDILREFSAELDLNQRYMLFYNNQALPKNAAIGTLAIPTDSVLSLSYREPSQAVLSAVTREVTAISEITILRLIEVNTGSAFNVNKLPALIGRYSLRDKQSVDVDLSLLAGADTVSRRHAQLTYDQERYSIMRLENTNPLTINGLEVGISEQHPLNHADILRLGEVELRIEITHSEQGE